MTPAAIIALVRDIVILIALGLLIWLLISYGKDVVKVADMKAVQKQLDQNTQTMARWSQEAQHAQVQRTQDLATIHDAIAAHSQPIVVLRDRPSHPGAVPGNPASPSGQPAACGNPDGGSRTDTVDIRPDISRFEERYEGILADCRAAIASWPH
jgi:hypothetical protein